MVAVLNSDEELSRKIKTIWNRIDFEFTPVFFSQGKKFLEFLNYELPEITIYNFTDSVLSTLEVFEEVKEDPWLHYGGIICIYQSNEEKEIIEQVKSLNILAFIRLREFEVNFERLLRIIKKNRQILFHRHFQGELMQSISGEFIIDNDPFDLNTHTHLITNYLYNASLIDHDGKDRLRVALVELLINAVEHGNCRITNKEKNDWLSDQKNMIDLIHEKNRDPEIRNKKVYLDYTVSPDSVKFTITDEGNGFDWRKKQEEPTSIEDMALHGRGIKMAKLYLSSVAYNEKGNAVSFEFPVNRETASVVPAVFSSETVVFQDGEIVFRENEESNYLYYIVSGKAKVYARGKELSTLSPQDMFLGEMSFLLNNRRSATIKAFGKCELLRISKKEFLTVMKRKPHYSIFLARLLAQRLQRLNKLSGSVVF
ncbi:MAG: cyclic nucleotide-binding domain-containing protein [Spirochaetales bacterium]|nr:cyclic nucleotide-binding domain-containing protein [Spirochaetales bacterium]